jgi:hypothetical protein
MQDRTNLAWPEAPDALGEVRISLRRSLTFSFAMRRREVMRRRFVAWVCPGLSLENEKKEYPAPNDRTANGSAGKHREMIHDPAPQRFTKQASNAMFNTAHD